MHRPPGSFLQWDLGWRLPVLECCLSEGSVWTTGLWVPGAAAGQANELIYTGDYLVEVHSVQGQA